MEVEGPGLKRRRWVMRMAARSGDKWYDGLLGVVEAIGCRDNCLLAC